MTAADLIPNELRGRLTVDVPTAGRLLGLGRAAAYAAAAEGLIPTLAAGRRLVVPVPKLLALVGLDLNQRPEHTEALSSTERATATVYVLGQKNGDLPHGRIPDPA